MRAAPPRADDRNAQLAGGSRRLQRRHRAMDCRIGSGGGGEKEQRQNAYDDKQTRLADDLVPHSYDKEYTSR